MFFTTKKYLYPKMSIAKKSTTAIHIFDRGFNVGLISVRPIAVRRNAHPI